MCVMKVDIDIERAAEALDEGDRAGAGGAVRISRRVPLIRGQRAVDDAEYTAHDGWTGGEEKPQGMREGHDPLTDWHLG